MTTDRSSKPATLYLTVVLVLSIAYQFIIYFAIGPNNANFGTLTQVLMWLPGAVALVFCFSNKQKLTTLGISLGRCWDYLIAFFVPVAITVITIAC